jgi:hypothetical protein
MTSGPVPTGTTVGRIDLCSRFQFNIKTACLAKRRESIDTVSLLDERWDREHEKGLI